MCGQLGLLAIATLVALPSEGGKIGCNIPPVPPGGSTSLTCLFSEDVNVSKKDFTVYHHPKDRRPDGVVDCLWLNGILKCFVRSGFVYDYQVSTNITVKLPRAFENQTGDYTCQVFGTDAGDIEKCTFTLKHDTLYPEPLSLEEPTQPDVNTSLNLEKRVLSDKLLESKPENLKEGSQAAAASSSSTSVIVPVCLAVLSLIVLIVAIVAYKLHRSRKHDSSKLQVPENDPLNNSSDNFSHNGAKRI